MSQPRNIILVGFMASGKTSVGKALSCLTGWPFVDADEVIVRQAGRSIPDIFAQEGEAAFRALERDTVTRLCRGEGQVIAAGGGAFVDPENRRRMLASGLVFCLQVRPETVLHRVNSLPERPMLDGDNPLERIQSLLSQRAEAYGQAHHTIETDDLTPAEAARHILGMCPPEVSAAPGGPTPGREEKG